MDGILNVYKEKGFTSHDVVAKLRGILHQKKIGHTGTLDPQAEGVLPVCLGSATKLCDMLADRSKTYQTEFLLGKETDTQDIFGKTVKEKEVIPDEERLKEIILSFTGAYAQIPPMYSAKKIKGKKLYELAREGKEIKREPSYVWIESIKMIRIEFPFAEMTVNCSKGTYIRTLCHDIGQKFGCGACMTKLLRTRVGDFSIGQAITLNQIEKLRDECKLQEKLISTEQVFKQYSRITVTEESVRLLYNGNALLEENLQEKDPKKEEPVRVYDNQNRFQALYQWNPDKQNFKPIKMFLRSNL